MRANKRVLIGYMPDNHDINFGEQFNINGEKLKNVILMFGNVGTIFSKTIREVVDSNGIKIGNFRKIKITIEEIK